MSRERAKGTAFETKVIEALIESGWPNAERRALSGARDKGDVSGVIGVVIEAKSVKTITLSEFVDEANTERDNANADLGVAWIKRRGKTSALDGYVAMDGHTFVQLLKDAGY